MHFPGEAGVGVQGQRTLGRRLGQPAACAAPAPRPDGKPLVGVCETVPHRGDGIKTVTSKTPSDSQELWPA